MTANPMRIWDSRNESLGTLALETAILAPTKIDAARLQGCIPRDIISHSSFAGKTTNEGPLVIGLSNGLSIAEIAEYFTADPQRFDDPGATEQSQRPILVTGFVGRHETVSLETVMRFMKWPGWHVKESTTIDFFVYNMGAALTTGTLVNHVINIRGDWLND